MSKLRFTGDRKNGMIGAKMVDKRRKLKPMKVKKNWRVDILCISTVLHHYPYTFLRLFDNPSKIGICNKT